jgi:hypothetical protein
MNGKTKSIILQVAFKEAAARGGSVSDTKDLTREFYDSLISLHTHLAIEPDDGAPRGGGGGGGGGGFTPKPRMATPPTAVAFALADGTPWLDYRACKVDGSVKPKFPDFKTSDGKASVYEFGLDGATNPQFAELVAASEKVSSLVNPF